MTINSVESNEIAKLIESAGGVVTNKSMVFF